MKKHAILLCSLLLAAPLLRAGDKEVIATQQAPAPGFIPTDFVNIESSYVFESDIQRGGVNFGSQDAFENSFEYGHRFLLRGNFYLHAGVAYQRFDFGNTDGPLPVHLQSGAGVIGIDYMRGEDVGGFIQFRPGFYTEEHLGINSFDCPITAARFFVVREDKFYILVGATYSFLRADYPVLPLIGFVWKPCPQWQIQAVPPAPKIIFSPNKQLSLWLGGEFAGGSFRTDRGFQGAFNPRLSGAQLDYVDYRAGVGFAYAASRNVSVDFSAGYSLQRQFNFERIDQVYRSDPAPYLRVGLNARF